MRALAEVLLERYGIVTRETVLAEGIPGGFAGALRRARQPRDARHRAPRLLRGGARRRPVRAARGDRAAAQPARRRAGRRRWCWPPPTRPTPTARRCPGRKRDDDSARRPSRVPGAYVVTLDAEPVLYVERGGKGLRAAARSRTSAGCGPPSRRWPTPCAAAACRAWASSASTASRWWAPRWASC